MPSIKGTASVSDARAMKKALKSTKFPKNFLQKVDLSKVNCGVIKEWVDARVHQILGFDDDIVKNLACNLFMPEKSDDGTSMSPEVNPKTAQLSLAGFLGDDQAAVFCKELYTLLLDAQQQAGGVPKAILEAKKKELEEKRRIEQSRHPQKPYHRDNYDRMPNNNNNNNNYNNRRGGGGGDNRGGGYGPRGGGRGNDRWRNEPPPRRNYRHDDYSNGPPRHYDDRGPPPRDNYRGPPRDYQRCPRPVSPPHSGYDDRDRGYNDRDQGPPYRGPAEDEFGRARMPPRGRSPDRNSDRRPPDNNYGRHESRHYDRDRTSGETPKAPPPAANNEGALQTTQQENDDAKQTGEGRSNQCRSRSPSARSSSSEDSYDRRRRRRRKEKDRKRERRSRRRDRRDRSDEEDSEDDRYKKRRGGRDSRSRSRSRDSTRRKRARSNSSGSSQYSDRRR